MAPPVSSPAARFADAYYVLNAALVAAFIPLVLYFRHVTPDGSDYGSLHSVHELSTWEQRALATFASILGWQLLRKRSWDHWAQSLFLYGEVLTGLTVFLMDKRLLPWYMLLCWAAMAVCPQPMYPLERQGEEGGVVELSPLALKDRVIGSNDATWLMFYYANGHQQSIAMAPAFAQVAARYANTRLRFGALDALLWPNVSVDVKVKPTTLVGQLPAVVLYHKGKEVDRLPRAADVDDIGLKRNYYTKTDVIKKLHLDRFAGVQS